MLKPKLSKSFKKDIKKAQRQKKDLEKLNHIMLTILSEQSLDPIYHDHPLGGDWKGYRDCHVTNDWVLIYKISRDDQAVLFARIASHAELFG